MRLFEATSKDGRTTLNFQWHMDEWGSIHDHNIRVETSQLNEEFRFGACARFGLKRVQQFLGDESVFDCELGFKNPHIITYKLQRSSNGAVSLTVADSTRSDALVVELGCDIEVRGLNEKDSAG